jgi:hypothetical protein
MSLNVANAFIQRLERNAVSFDIVQSYTGTTGRVWRDYIYKLANEVLPFKDFKKQHQPTDLKI